VEQLNLMQQWLLFLGGIVYPVYTTSYGSFIDGAFIQNNPCVIAYEEGKAFWPGNMNDIILSIGTGKAPQQSDQLTFSSQIKATVNDGILNESEWIYLKDLENKLETNTLIRVNPEFSIPIDMLDDFKERDLQHEMDVYFDREGNREVFDISNRLQGLMFYTSISSVGNRLECRVFIRETLSNESQVFKDIKSVGISKAFEIRVGPSPSLKGDLLVEGVSWTKSDTFFQAVFEKPFNFDCVFITVLYMINCRNELVREGFPISGVPQRIILKW